MNQQRTYPSVSRSDVTGRAILNPAFRHLISISNTPTSTGNDEEDHSRCQSLTGRGAFGSRPVRLLHHRNVRDVVLKELLAGDREPEGAVPGLQRGLSVEDDAGLRVDLRALLQLVGEESARHSRPTAVAAGNDPADAQRVPVGEDTQGGGEVHVGGGVRRCPDLQASGLQVAPVELGVGAVLLDDEVDTVRCRRITRATPDDAATQMEDTPMPRRTPWSPQWAGSLTGTLSANAGTSTTTDPVSTTTCASS